MDYLDFDLRISAGGEGRYTLDVQSPAGEASGLPITLADSELRRDLTAIERVRGGFVAERSLVPHKEEARADEAACELGRVLFEALMGERVVYGCYQASLDRARREEKGLRVRLRIDAPELAVLPWEYLYDPELLHGHLGLSSRTPLVRHLERPLAIEPLSLEPPIHILGMVGASHGLDVEGEKRLMEIAVEHHVERGNLELTWMQGSTWSDLLEAMRKGPWHVFHFIGHGGFDAETGEGVLLFEAEAGGETAAGGGSGGQPPSFRLSAHRLADVLADHPSLRLVVLNSCEGARASRSELFSSTASILAARGIPAVVSMQYEITDNAALALAQTFYDLLAEGMAVDTALSEARKAISGDDRIKVEWVTPVLHMRSPNGSLFRVGVDIFQSPAPPPATWTESPSLAAPQAMPGDAESRRGLLILLRRVRRDWIDGVLANSLHHAARLELGLEAVHGAVVNPWGSLLETRGAGSTSLPPGRTLGQVLEEVGGSLLLLGEPGSGKTTTLLELCRDLLEAAEQKPERPVPVVFTLSTWDASHASLAEWMVQELAAKYQIPPKVGRAWLAGRRILPLLDGLDEVAGAQRSGTHRAGTCRAGTYRASAVEAINRFVEEALVGVVVCCRLKEYRQLPVRLSLNAAIRLQPLSREQVLAQVAEAGPRLAALATLLRRDPGMLIEARSPLMLNLMMRAYRDLPAEDLAGGGMKTAAERREMLMAAYVAAMFRRARTGSYHD